MSNGGDAFDVTDLLNVINDLPSADYTVENSRISEFERLVVSSPVSKDVLRKRILSSIPGESMDWVLPSLGIQETNEGYLMTPRGNNKNVSCWGFCPDGEDEGTYRIKVDDRYMKYVRIELPGSRFMSTQLLFLLIPNLPLGNWNDCGIKEDPETGRAMIEYCDKAGFCEIQNYWHPRCFDYLEFEVGRKWGDLTHAATHPTLGAVLLKHADFYWEIKQMEKETEIYQVIEGHHVGLKFLGHVAEGGRIIGFALGGIDGLREAGPQDAQALSTLLARLDFLGIGFDFPKYHEFAVQDGRALVVNFAAGEYEHAADLDERFGVLWPPFSELF